MILIDFFGIAIEPAAFSAFMSKIFRPLILRKCVITKLDNFFMQNMKTAPDESQFCLTRVKFLGHLTGGNTITPIKSRLGAIMKLQPRSNKKNPWISWNAKFLK